MFVSWSLFIKTRNCIGVNHQLSLLFGIKDIGGIVNEWSRTQVAEGKGLKGLSEKSGWQRWFLFMGEGEEEMHGLVLQGMVWVYRLV